MRDGLPILLAPLRQPGVYRRRDRAALAGWSAGDPGSAGTFGFVAAGSTDGKTSVLSNAHVPALASTGSLLRAGIAIRQPGGYDGGSSSSRNGALARYVPLTFRSTRANNGGAFVDLLSAGSDAKTVVCTSRYVRAPPGVTVRGSLPVLRVHRRSIASAFLLSPSGRRPRSPRPTRSSRAMAISAPALSVRVFAGARSPA